MTFEDYVSSLTYLQRGEEKEYWLFKVRFEHTKSIWIYYRSECITVTHSMEEAKLVVRAIYKAMEVEFK